MAKSSPISCNGVLYNSILELANAFGIHPSTVARRVRDGWSSEQAVGVSTKPKRVGHGTESPRVSRRPVGLSHSVVAV